MKKTGWVVLLMCLLIGCATPVQPEQNPKTHADSLHWKTEIEKTLKLFGHRNWIVIADAAYPQQSNPSIKTITVDTDQLETVEFVKALIEQSKHVSATIFLDKELALVTEGAAKGIDAYRTRLDSLLHGKAVNRMLHEDIIRALDESAKLFNVLILKTDLTIPYTSVFFQLECGYWDAESEKKLRTGMSAK